VRFGITGFDEPDGDNCSDINSPSSIQVDDLVILPDALGVCPPVGLLGNGDFEAGDDGWDLTDYVEVCAGLGRDGTTGLRLIGAEHGASRLVSVPLPTTLAAPAVEVWVQGDLRSGLTVALGSVVLAALDASDIPAVHRVCVPPWAHGMVLPLDFVTDASFEAVIDDVGLVSESRCGAGLLLDGGFEQTAATPVIHTGWLGSGYHPDSSEGRVVLDPLRARTGDAVGVLSVSKRCRGAHLVTSYQVPSPQGSAGPALRLWYRTVALQQAALSLSSPRVSLPASDTWTQRTVCLSPATAGQLRQLWISFGNSFSGSDCGTAIPPELALVDDVEVTTDPACPATAP
jgi:hypothetical protein